LSLSHHKERDKGYPFHLKRPNTDTKTSIYLKTSFYGVPFKYYLGNKDYRIYPRLWDKETQRPTTDKNLIDEFSLINPHIKTELRSIKTRIGNVESTIKSYISNVQTNKKTFDLNELKALLDKIIKEVKEITPEAKGEFLFPYIETVIKDMETGKVLISTGKKKGQRYTHGTIKNYKGFSQKWSLFEKYIGKKIRYEQVNKDLFDQLIAYFNTQSLSANTISKHIRYLKVIMQRSYDEGLHSNDVHRNKSFSAPEVEVTNIYLTAAEIRALDQHDLSERPTDQKIRDVFAIGCYCALRYSDYSRIRPQHIKTKTINGKRRKVIDIITKKTGERVIIPIKPELDTLLARYDYQVPKTYEQKVNERIKVIASEVGINEPIEIEKIKGGLKIKSTVPKYDLIKTHTSRRSAITNMYLSGIETQYIMKMSGHKTEKSFMKYLKITKEDAISKIAHLDYFNDDKTDSKIINL
jgi:integrase